MSTKTYIITLHKKEDLESFYNDMEKINIPLILKRPLSRNTHYEMTSDQAIKISKDPRVWDVELLDNFDIKSQYVNNTPYTKSGVFWKDDTVAPTTVNPTDFQWGHLHCAGNQTQRGKGSWGSGSTFELVNATVSIFNDGKYVDVIIVDDPISYDSNEWNSPSTGTSRFVQYQWFNDLNSLVTSIDDDIQTLPSGTITYDQNSNLSYYHGNHVAGTVAGQYYGWAREANIYNLAVTAPWSSGQSIPALLIFDYLRAFHRNKPINPETGRKNFTITNHSYGGIRYMPQKGVDGENNPIYRLDFSDVVEINYRGSIYNISNPGPSGWTEAGIETDFGVRLNTETYPRYSAAINADIIDAIADGIVVIGASGNDNLLISTPSEPDWNNLIFILDNNTNTVDAFYYMRGGWPNSPDSGAITVSALSNKDDFRRSSYTNYGPGIDIFAPGDNIISAFNNTGLVDTKYGPGNYFYPISGSSMASPQLTGIAACLAANKERFTQEDVAGYIQQHSINGDMTFDISTGGYDDETSQQGSVNKYLHLENPRSTSGLIQEQKGVRRTGMTFPRTNNLFK
jgi:hypothetical protein